MTITRRREHLTKNSTLWQRLLRATIEQVSLMSAAEQTRLSWANSIRAVEEIPSFYLDYLQVNLPDLSVCLPAVLTPTFRGFLRRENEKLVFTYDERLYILEQTQSGLLPTVFPVVEINYIEVGAILLKAWLRISGLIDGRLASQTLKFNTVTQFLFDPLVSHLRSTHSAADLTHQPITQSEAGLTHHPFTLSEAERSRKVSEAEPTYQPFTLSEAERSRKVSEAEPTYQPFTLSEAERSRRVSEADRNRMAQTTLHDERLKFDPLRLHYFKFMSYARMSLQPGQHVVDYLMQPEMRLPRLNLLGRPLSMRTLDTAHLCILTTAELIVIRDDPSSMQSCNDTRYGGVWDYIPLCRVLGADLEERADSLAMVLQLPGDERLEVLFTPNLRPQAERLCAQIAA